MVLKLGMQHKGLKLCKVYTNDNPWFTLTFTAGSICSPICLDEENCYVTKYVQVIGNKLAPNDKIDQVYDPGDCLSLSRG